MIDLNNLGKGKKSYKKKVEPPKVERTHYMPDEDEVYIGAEFILRHRKTGKTKVDIYNGHISPKLYLSRAGISVTKKYLDKQDIESLGFTAGEELYKKNNITLQLHNDNKVTINYYNEENKGYRTAVEFITVKSKDYLKRILKMLNI